MEENNNKKETTTIVITLQTKELLIEKKLVESETYNSVIQRLLEKSNV